jgi:hypothetical protein
MAWTSRVAGATTFKGFVHEVRSASSEDGSATTAEEPRDGAALMPVSDALGIAFRDEVKGREMYSVAAAEVNAALEIECLQRLAKPVRIWATFLPTTSHPGYHLCERVTVKGRTEFYRLDESITCEPSLAVAGSMQVEASSLSHVKETVLPERALVSSIPDRKRPRSEDIEIKTTKVAFREDLPKRITTASKSKVSRQARAAQRLMHDSRWLREQLGRLCEGINAQARFEKWEEITQKAHRYLWMLGSSMIEVVLEVLDKPDCYALRFETSVPGSFEKFHCSFALIEGVIEVTAFNNEHLLHTLSYALNIKVVTEEMDAQWLTARAWNELKASMKADRSSAYTRKLATMLQSLFQVDSYTRGLYWVDMDELDEADTRTVRCLKLTCDYRPFHFQIIQKSPSQLGLSDDTQMISLCFWEGEDAEQPLL